MSQYFSVDRFEWIESKNYTEDFIKSYDEISDAGYMLKIDIKYLEKLRIEYNEFSFFT